MKKISNYIGAIVVILLMALFVAWQRNLTDAKSAKEIMGALSDCFFVPGVFLTGVGTISWASLTGIYDILSFGGGRAVRWFVPTMDKEKYDDFYQYKLSKEKKGRTWKPQILICGLLSLLLTFIFYFIYSVL